MSKITINKAIEILDEKIKYEYSAVETDEGNAVKLGQQALTRIQHIRKWADDMKGYLLPGETPPGDSP